MWILGLKGLMDSHLSVFSVTLLSYLHYVEKIEWHKHSNVLLNFVL